MKVPLAASMVASPEVAERTLRAKGLSRQASRITRFMRLPASSILPSTRPTSTDSYSTSRSPFTRIRPSAHLSLVINGVSLLETELSNGQTHHVLIINFQAPPSQEIERRHRPRNTGAEIRPHAMAHFLAMEDCGEHRQHGFHHHPR